MPTDRAQKVQEKNGFICLVIMFTPRVMVFKMSKMVTGKNLSDFGMRMKDLVEFLKKMAWLISFELNRF